MNRFIAALVVLVGVLAGFYGGARYGEAHASASNTAGSTAAAGPAASAPTGNGSGARGGGNFVTPAASGPIVAVADGTITVHDRQTGKDVKVSVGSARISKTTQGTPADLTQNQNVTVSGQTGADGTVSAQVITVGGGGFGGGGRARPSPSA